jgi:serine/threonine protein kinase
LKPENILWDEKNKKFKISDFYIYKILTFGYKKYFDFYEFSECVGLD